ncbi:hypothetical protein MMC28_000113 [Mycoblastus sanguinarius]|nr:hypothetical protein [Mycoblastus sanguinarius]
MSFLNSVLSSIGGNGAPISTPPPQTPRPQNANATQRTPRVEDGPSPSNSSGIQNNKRKADDGLAGRTGKFLKNDNTNGLGGRALPKNPQLPMRNTKPPVSTLSTTRPGPYRGTSKPDPAPAKPATPTGDAPKAPKKGSYAEIMARSKAAQDKPPAVGTISHKPKEKIAVSYKKELKLKKKALKDKKLGIKSASRPGSSDSKSSSPMPQSSKKKAIQPGYQGTAKPKLQPTYKGTMKPVSADEKSASRDRNRDSGQASRNRINEYAATDDEDLEDEDEDEDGEGSGEGSDESDDMEAGFSDVEQEESVAARAARKEDEEEARLEAKLKSEKEERKKRLEQLAKKAKPQRY